MNFNLKIDDQPTLQRRPRKRPPDFTSRAFRLRLLTMFAALVLVLVAIKEAGRPERWGWLDAAMDRERVAVVEEDNGLLADGADVARRSDDLSAQPIPQAVILPMESAVWETVEDGTPVGHMGDRDAWSAVWQRANATSQTGLDSAQPVQRVQLMAQPNVYRGRWVTVDGWLKGARRVERPIAALGAAGQGGYYELWIRPQESTAGPYCVYALTLPSDFPVVGSEFQTLDEKVTATACFFKNRSYVAADESPEICPWLIAGSVRWNRVAAGDLEQSSSSWRPSAVEWGGIVVAFGLLAIGIAWWARQTAQTPRYQPGPQAREQIDQSLQALVSDPDVMSDRERVAALGGQDDAAIRAVVDPSDD